MRIVTRPNGYAICALLAGALVGGAFQAQNRDWLELLALWVLVDLALGAFYAGLVHLVRLLPLADERRRFSPHDLATAVVGAGLALLIATLLDEPVTYITQAALALGVVAVLAAGRSPRREAMPMLVGLQVLVAWTLGFVWVAHWQNPLLALAPVAAVGTWCRLRERSLSDGGTANRTMIWATRLAWAAWVGALIVARQPLLAGVVAVTALADDMHRLVPLGQRMSAALLDLSWLGSWFLVAVATSYWGLLP